MHHVYSNSDHFFFLSLFSLSKLAEITQVTRATYLKFLERFKIFYRIVGALHYLSQLQDKIRFLNNNIK